MLSVSPCIRGLVFLQLAVASILGFAGGETVKSPILDRIEMIYSAPSDLGQMNLKQLEAEKAARIQDLAVIQRMSGAPDIARQKFLEIIFEHDDKRLRIVEVIPGLIEKYQITGEFRTALLGYRDTFDRVIRDARNHVHDLEDYKSYDFRFSAVYMSMMFKFSENPEIQKRIIADMKNPDTLIGRYQKEMADSYSKVEDNRYLVQDSYSIEELERAIAVIEDEITRRSHEEL